MGYLYVSNGMPMHVHAMSLVLDNNGKACVPWQVLIEHARGCVDCWHVNQGQSLSPDLVESVVCLVAMASCKLHSGSLLDGLAHSL